MKWEIDDSHLEESEISWMFCPFCTLKTIGEMDLLSYASEKFGFSLSEIEDEYRRIESPKLLIVAIKQGKYQLFRQLVEASGETIRESVPALTSSLRHRDRSVRLAAAEAIVTLGPIAAEMIPALVEALISEARSNISKTRILNSLNSESSDKKG